MTTYTLNGFKVTSTSGTPSAVTAASMEIATSGSFFFRYTMDAALANAYSSITMTNTLGKIQSAKMAGTRFSFDEKASVAQLTWNGLDGEGQPKVMKTMMMMIDLGVANEKFYIAMGGDDLPAFGTLTAYTDWLADVTATSSVITDSNGWRPNTNILMTNFKDAGVVTAQADNITGLSGTNDWSTKAKTLFTEAGNDTVTGMTGVDYISAGDGNDSVNGGAGNDVLSGESGADTISGGTGDDVISGGTYGDLLNGEDGNDKINGGLGNDTINGGNGTDRIDASVGNDSVLGSAGNDTIIAGDGDDFVDGGTDADLITGGIGADVLQGGTGNDTINGGAGSDDITGGTGNDRLIGGTGIDDFFFGNLSGADVVTDFRNNGDRLFIDDNYGVANATQALALATQVGRNVVFDFGDGDSLTVLNIQKAALTDDIVIF